MDDFLLNNEDDIIYFETEDYLNDILRSYHYDEGDIFNQISQDLPRADVYWGKRKISNLDKFLKLSKRFKNKGIVMQDQIFHIQTILAMLINQSSYYFPYKTICNTFGDNHKNYLIKCLSDNRYIKFNNIGDDLIIDIRADFMVINMKTSHILKHIKTSIVLHLNDKGFKRYGMFFY